MLPEEAFETISEYKAEHCAVELGHKDTVVRFLPGPEDFVIGRWKSARKN
jgi:hypothetical protein